MADPTWLDPHLSWASGTAVAVLFVLCCVVQPVRGRAAYRRLVADRAAGVPDALVHRLRRMARRQLVTTVAVVVVVAVAGGVRRGDVGLRLPAGDRVHYWTTYTVALCVLILVTGLLLRRRAVNGRSVPGQRPVRALVAATSRERGYGTLVAVGAGVSEEVLFRGLFTAAAVAAFGISGVVAAVVVSICFGLCHVYQGWPGVVGTALGGGLFSLIYLDTRSLLLPIVLHIAIDLRGLVLVPPATERAPRRWRSRLRPSRTMIG